MYSLHVSEPPPTRLTNVAVAKSLTLVSPYRQSMVRPIDSSARNIDSYRFRDDDVGLISIMSAIPGHASRCAFETVSALWLYFRLPVPTTRVSLAQ